MKIIGVVGGVASGKSAVAAQLQELGAAVLDADAAGHAVLRETDVKQAVRARWGDAVFGPDGEIDRPALGRIVFGSQSSAATDLKYLEGLTHPHIAKRLSDEIVQFTAGGEHPAAVLDAAVLFRSGWDRFCDKLIFVDAPRPVRLARARSRGWSEGELSRREAAQEPLPEKQARCDVTIDNSGDLSDTRRQVAEFWGSLFLPPVSK